MTRTIEHRLKFDHGLTIGVHLVEFTGHGRTRRALVEIGRNGGVYGLMEPRAGDMYAAWDRIKGDTWAYKPGTVAVWPAKSPEFMARFAGPPRVTVPLIAEVAA